MEETKAYSISVSELAASDAIPDAFSTAKQLIYASPATLAFHSPGAQGFGVKRAALVVPGSVMLLVAPACCGRNTRLLSEVKGYENRYFFLLMDESDIVTGRHLKKIPQAVQEILDFLDQKPSVVFLCSTCVDALLGTDWDRVAAKAEEATGVPVRPCTMYALTRQGRKPPMETVRQTIYDLLPKTAKNPRACNILGFFSDIDQESELFSILKSFGLRKIRQVSSCRDYGEFQEMAEANFNLVLNPEAMLAAQDLEERLSIPSIEIRRLYQLDKIHRQYEGLSRVLGASLDDGKYFLAAKSALNAFQKKHRDLHISIGETLNANPFELSLALSRYGFHVEEIFASVTANDLPYIRRLAALSPDTRVYTNLSPTMLFYDCGSARVDLTIGQDAHFYHANTRNVPWNGDLQPFGYAGLAELITQMDRALEERA